MKCNYRMRSQEKYGERLDSFINLGVQLALLALHNEYRFGPERLHHLERTIRHYTQDEIISGATPFTPEYRNNLEHGLDKIEEAYAKIFEKERK